MKQQAVIGALVLFLLLSKPKQGNAPSGDVMTISYLGQNNLPKGIRNNNPGNIRIANNPWQGKIPVSQNTDGAFEQFTAFVFGVRAMIKLLSNHINNGYNTIHSLINKYAPVSDNSQQAVDHYINYVSSRTGLQPYTIITPSKANLKKLVAAMSYVENGREAVANDMFEAAYNITGLGKIESSGQMPKGSRSDEYWRKRGVDNVENIANKYKKTFNLKSIEFGNWVNQGERHLLVTLNGEGLKRLAKIIAYPYRKMGFGNKLTLGIGSRGRGGGAKAHFESWNMTINMTKTKGEGSLAHEWAHALDLVLGNGKKYASGGRSTRKTTNVNILRDKTVEGAFERLFDALYYNKDSTKTKFNETVSKWSPYWNYRTEVFARTIQAYVFYKNNEKGIRDRYVANISMKSGLWPNKALIKKATPAIREILKLGKEKIK